MVRKVTAKLLINYDIMDNYPTTVGIPDNVLTYYAITKGDLRLDKLWLFAPYSYHLNKKSHISNSLTD